jgi:hypothetical protein
VPSVIDYLLVAHDRLRLEHYTRGRDDTWVLRERLRIPAQHADERRDNDSAEQRRSAAGQTADETLTGELATMELQL